MRHLPRYPIYVISKGRSDCCLTAKFLMKDKVPFRVVCEPQEAELYKAEFGEHVLVAPEDFSKRGQGGIPVRNFVWEHSKTEGHERHWILDDNIRRVYRFYHGIRLRSDSGPGFACIEDFTDRYENIAISGMAYSFFARLPNIPPFWQNVHVYSCLLIKNDLPFRWRGRYNEDTDLCLQVLAGGWCTILVNAFLVEKMRTLTMKGGNMEQLYKGDGRLRMARDLKKAWPHVVDIDRRFQRPQHIVRGNWRGFDTPLKLKPGVSIDGMVNGGNEYGLELTAVGDVKSPELKKLISSAGNSTPDPVDPASS